MKMFARARAWSEWRNRRTPDADGTARVRLLKVVATLMCGGTENSVHVARTLPRSHVASIWNSPVCGGRAVSSDELDERGIPLREYHISTFRSVRALAHQTRFARHVARRRIDIVHAYSFYGNVFAIPPARIAGAPVVIASIRDLAPYLTPAQKHVQRLACHYADCVLVNADAVRSWLISEQYDPSKIVVIRNGVDVSPLCSRERALVRLLGEFGMLRRRLWSAWCRV